MTRFLFIFLFFFFFNDTATTEIYTLSLHDALPICDAECDSCRENHRADVHHAHRRSEEHTSELQSRRDLVCRLLLEKKQKQNKTRQPYNKNRTKKTKQHTKSTE